MENHRRQQVIDQSSSPYVSDLVHRCATADDYRDIGSPSLPNYLAATSGSNQGVQDDGSPARHPIHADNLFRQARTAGLDSKSYEDAMDAPCSLASSGTYAVKHNPAAYYTNVRADCGGQDIPLGSTPDIGSRFTFVTPNLCNDMHDCSVSTGDSWLSSFLPKILSSSAYTGGGTAVFITWDEDDNSAGNSVPLLVISPYTAAGTRYGVAVTHYALLRTTEDLLGLGCLGAACTAPSMRSPFGI